MIRNPADKSRAIPAIAPITIPAMAPPPSEDDDPLLGWEVCGDDGVEAEVGDEDGFPALNFAATVIGLLRQQSSESPQHHFSDFGSSLQGVIRTFPLFTCSVLVNSSAHVFACPTQYGETYVVHAYGETLPTLPILYRALLSEILGIYLRIGAVLLVLIHADAIFQAYVVGEAVLYEPTSRIRPFGRAAYGRQWIQGIVTTWRVMWLCILNAVWMVTCRLNKLWSQELKGVDEPGRCSCRCAAHIESKPISKMCRASRHNLV
jgi:hypothetical protein